jgi:hypothetical protein
MQRNGFCMGTLQMTFVQIKCLLIFMTELNCKCYYIFCMNNSNLKFCRKFRLVSLSPSFMSRQLSHALSKVPFYKYILLVILFLLPIQVYIMILIMNYCLRFYLLSHQPPVAQGLRIHQFSRSHSKAHHIRQDSSGRVISPSQRSLSDNTQHCQQTHPCHRWDSNQQSQEARGRKPTH